MRSILLRLILTLTLAASTTLHAQSYDLALKHYFAGEFSTSEGIILEMLKAKQTAAKKAQLYKMLGLNQYMQGKRAEATGSFQKAKSLSPKIQITSLEMIDSTVLDFFNSIETPAAAEPEKVEPTPIPQATHKKPRKETVVTKQETGPTKLLILSNVINARVVVDGVTRGRVGDLIPIDPGYHNVDIYATGYVNELQTLNMEAGQLNRYTITLEKIPEETAPTPISPAPVEAPQKVVSENVKKPAAKKKPRRKISTAKEVHKQDSKKDKPKEYTLSEPIYAIPFGVPQYAQGKILTGLGFSILQGATLGFSISRFMDVSSTINETNTTVNERNVEESQIQNTKDRQAFAAATDQYYSEQVTAIQALQKEAYIGLSLFLLTWIASGVEAYINPPVITSQVKKEVEEHPALFAWTVNPGYVPPSHINSQGQYTLNIRFRF